MNRYALYRKKKGGIGEFELHGFGYDDIDLDMLERITNEARDAGRVLICLLAQSGRLDEDEDVRGQILVTYLETGMIPRMVEIRVSAHHKGKFHDPNILPELSMVLDGQTLGDILRPKLVEEDATLQRFIDKYCTVVTVPLGKPLVLKLEPRSKE